MPKGHSIVTSQHSQIRKRGNQPQRANFFVRGVIVFEYGVVTPGGDYTLIREEIARQYGVPVEDVTVEVRSGSAVINYTIARSTTTSFVDINKITRSIATIIISNPGPSISFSGLNLAAIATTINSSGVTTPAQPVVYSCPLFTDIFDSTGNLMQNYTLGGDCILTLTQSVFIGAGKELVLLPRSSINTNGFTITNNGGITNYGGIYTDNRGQILNNNRITNNGTLDNSAGGTITNTITGIINPSSTDSGGGIGIIYNSNGGTIINIGTIFIRGFLNNNGGTINNNGIINNNDKIINYNGRINNISTLKNNGDIDNSSGGAFINFATGVIINYSSINNGTSNSSLVNNGVFYNGGTIMPLSFPVSDIHGDILYVPARVGPNIPLFPLNFYDIFDNNGNLKQNYTLTSGNGLILTQSITIGSGKTIQLLERSVIITNGFRITINTGGKLSSLGTIINDSTITNYDIFINKGIIINQTGSTISNLAGLITNTGTITNNGTLRSGNIGGIDGNGTIGPNPITYYCLSRSDIVDSPSNRLKTSYTLPAGCVLSGQLIIDAGQELILMADSYFYTNGYPITIFGKITNYGTIINNNGSILFAGTGNVGIGSMINNGVMINTGAQFKIGDTCPFVNNGTIEFNDCKFKFDYQNEGTITNYGKFNNNTIFCNNFRYGSISRSGKIINYGTINNLGSISNGQALITNYSTIYNTGRIYNIDNDFNYYGEVNNISPGTIGPNPIDNSVQ